MTGKVFVPTGQKVSIEKVYLPTGATFIQGAYKAVLEDVCCDLDNTRCSIETAVSSEISLILNNNHSLIHEDVESLLRRKECLLLAYLLNHGQGIECKACTEQFYTLLMCECSVCVYLVVLLL